MRFSVFFVIIVLGATFAGLRSNGSDATNSCQMSPRAANLVKILDNATPNMRDARGQPDIPGKGGRTWTLSPETGKPLNWTPHCSQYFRAVMRELGTNGIAGSEQKIWTSENTSADSLISKMQGSKDWISVSGNEAVQALANRGIVVVGTVPGHLGFAFPIPEGLDVAFFSGSGPFVRDGNEHPVDARANGQLFPSTWGAVKTSKAFGKPESVQWFQFKPSVPSLWENLKDRVSSWTSGPTTGSCVPINPPQPAELDDSGCAYPAAVECQDQCWAKYPTNALHALECAALCKSANGCCLNPLRNFSGEVCF